MLVKLCLDTSQSFHNLSFFPVGMYFRANVTFFKYYSSPKNQIKVLNMTDWHNFFLVERSRSSVHRSKYVLIGIQAVESLPIRFWKIKIAGKDIVLISKCLQKIQEILYVIDENLKWTVVGGIVYYYK